MDLELEQIERQFDRAAATYDSVASVQRQMASRLLEKIPVQLDGTLIDLGCGTGELLQKLAQRIPADRLTGVDISSAMLRQTQARSPQVKTVKANLAALPFEADCFNWAVSNAAIQWCNAHDFFAELRRILGPKGRAFISTFGPDTMWQWRKALGSVAGENNRVHAFPSIDHLTNELRSTGFREVESMKETIDFQFDSVRTMFDSIRKLGATNARRDRPSGLSGRQWLQQVTEAFESTRDDNGMLRVTYECYYLFAS